MPFICLFVRGSVYTDSFHFSIATSARHSGRAPHRNALDLKQVVSSGGAGEPSVAADLPPARIGR